MKKVLMAAAILAVGLSSCSHEETTIGTVNDHNAINFDPYAGRAGMGEKGTVTDGTSMETTGFGLMGYFHDGGADLDANQIFSTTNNDFPAKPNYMHNQEVTSLDNGGTWTYSPTKYWSNDPEDSYSFFAYAPYAVDFSDGIAISGKNDAGLPFVLFTIKDDPADMIDFVAGQKVDMTKPSNGLVQLNMKHQLTRLDFAAKLGDNIDPKTKIVFKSIKTDHANSTAFWKASMYTYPNGVTTNTDEEDHTQDGTWDYSNFIVPANTDIDVADIFATPGNVDITSNTVTPLLADGEYLFLIPPAGPAGASAAENIKFIVEYDIVTEDSDLAGDLVMNNKISFDLPNGTLKQGHAYKFVFTIDLEKVTLTPNTIGWDISEETPGTPIDITPSNP